jgi:hypothetical protein
MLPLTAWVMWHARSGVTGGIIDPTPMVGLIDLTHMAGLTVLPPMEWVTAREWAMWDTVTLASARRMEWPEAASYTTVAANEQSQDDELKSPGEPGLSSCYHFCRSKKTWRRSEKPDLLK